jgi:hypothetical protein
MTVKPEVGSANFYYITRNVNPQIFLVIPLSANPLIFQICLRATQATLLVSDTISVLIHFTEDEVLGS